MYPEPHRLVTETELWLRWADAHGVRYDDSGMSFDEIARDYYGTSDAYRELLAPDLMGTTSATHQAAADTAYVRALLIEAAIGRRGGDLDIYVDPVQVLDPAGRIVSRRSTPEVGGWESIATPVADREEAPQPHACPTTGFRP